MAVVDPVDLLEYMRAESRNYSADRSPATNLQLVTFLAIAYAEQFGRDTTRGPELPTDQTNEAGNTPPSTDRGIWMENSYWWADVLDACAFDWKCATREAAKRTKGFRSSRTLWSAYGADGQGNYRYWIPLAWTVMRNVSCRDLRKAADADVAEAKLEQSRLELAQAELTSQLDEARKRILFLESSSVTLADGTRLKGVLSAQDA